MRRIQALIATALICLGPKVYADEISLLSGFYDSQENDPGIKAQTISLGGRYGLAMNPEEKSFWFIDGGLSSTSYSGDNAPDSATGFRLGAGQKYFFKNFTKSIHSYLTWAAGFVSENSSDATTDTETQGLYYAGSGGFRFDFTKTIYFEIDARFFESLLTGSTKRTVTATGVTAETKRTQLLVDTFSGADSLSFGVGMIF